MASSTLSVPLVTPGEAGITGSCGCHATSGSAAVFPALAVLVLLALRSRRRVQ
jgi:MYXO-CTERM domain-containing protein